MKAAVWHARRDIRIEQQPDPEPAGPGEALVRVALAGICGTDLHEYTSGPQYIPTEPHPRTGVRAPLTLGHEMAGTVVDAGAGVARARVGDRVAIFAILGCGQCRLCKRSLPALCTTMVATGLSTGDGGLSEYVRVKDRQLYPLPDSLSFTQGALVEPAACAVRAVHLGEVQTGDIVLITGAGPIGQLTAMAALASGAQAVYMSEVVPARRELAGQNLQATVLDPSTTDVPQTLRDATEGWGADVVFECSASPRAFADALAATRKGGTLVQFGVFTREVPLQPADLTNYERRIQGNLAYAPPDFDRTIELMRSGQLPAERIVTAEIPLADVVELGFDELIRPNTTHAKIHIRPT
ncbi:MAG: 2,3-butanediol dehydrogenase [Chloroflexota bacterium]|nr:2,3-butanediol dehydrogenase [Chloroflexota bacterium]